MIKNLFYIIIILITGFSILNLISLESTNAISKDKSKSKPKEVSSNSKGITKIGWRLLHKFDYKKGKIPKEIKKIDGKLVKIPGYIVPLSDNYSQLDEFLLVPYAQACIHVPPPPPNLIINVKLRKPIPVDKTSNPAWVIGVFKVKKTKSQYGGSVYYIDGTKLKKFEY